MPAIAVEDTFTPIDSVQYNIDIEFSVNNEIIQGQTLQGNELNKFSRWGDEVSFGNIEFFICDKANYQKYISGQPFKAYKHIANADSGNLSFPFPTSPDTGAPWYIVFSNEDQCKSTEIINLKATVSNGWFAAEEKGNNVDGINIYPTVVTSGFYLKINNNSEKVSLEVYDLTGRCVKKMKEQTSCFVKMDKKDFSSGIYFIKLNTGNKIITKKLVRL
jgi:hypothetical protein